MASPSSNPYRISPIGLGRYTWINKPDTKFNADGLYKTDLILDGEEAAKFKALIDAQCEAALVSETEDMTPGERKKWAVYLPYEVEEDDDGNPTGRIIFQFRQNAVIHLKDGTTKEIRIAIFDAADKAVDVPVFGGSKLRVLYRARPIKIASLKKAGVRLDFLKVQVIALAERSQESGFGAVEGGYVAEEEEETTGGFGAQDSAPPPATDADY